MAPSYKVCRGIDTTPFPYQKQNAESLTRFGALLEWLFLDLRLRQGRPSPKLHPRGKSRDISLDIGALFFEH